jgi:hypothetical protein
VRNRHTQGVTVTAYSTVANDHHHHHHHHRHHRHRHHHHHHRTYDGQLSCMPTHARLACRLPVPRRQPAAVAVAAVAAVAAAVESDDRPRDGGGGLGRGRAQQQQLLRRLGLTVGATPAARTQLCAPAEGRTRCCLRRKKRAATAREAAKRCQPTGGREGVPAWEGGPHHTHQHTDTHQPTSNTTHACSAHCERHTLRAPEQSHPYRASAAGRRTARPG